VLGFAKESQFNEGMDRGYTKFKVEQEKSMVKVRVSIEWRYSVDYKKI
jgi:hypothetical protein